MSVNANPQAVTFTVQVMRPLAQRYLDLYSLAREAKLRWFGQAISSVIPNDTAVIDDGAGSTGDPLATNAAVTNVITRAIEFTDDLEAFGNAKLNTLLAIAKADQFGK